MTITFTARSGEGYEQLMGRWSRLLAPAFIDFAGLAAGERVLDLGCGTGSLTEALAHHPDLASITGIDLSEPYLALARSRVADPRVTFDQGDATALPYADASFDRALSLLVLHFVPEPLQAVRELRRVVRPGGTVAAAVWDTFGGLPHMRMVSDIAAALDPAARHRLLHPLTAPGELAALWREAGLHAIEQTSLLIRFDFESFEDYWRPFLSGDGPVGSYVVGLPDAARDHLKSTLRRAYESNRPDGPRSFAGVAWACRGVVR